jgi:hypothetical protein
VFIDIEGDSYPPRESVRVCYYVDEREKSRLFACSIVVQCICRDNVVFNDPS